MSRPHWFRFTLGQLLAVVAATAVLLTAATLSSKGQRIYLDSIRYCVDFSLIILFIINIRISKWMWLVVASYACRHLWAVLVNLMPRMRARDYHYIVITMYLTLDTVFSVLFVAGLAMVFRDVRRSSTDREEARPST